LLPNGQEVQLVDPATEYCPAKQSTSWVGSEHCFPTLQVEHVV